MPCDDLVAAGQGATLLIHEATMDDALEEMAKEKAHSTVSQALDVALRYAGSSHCGYQLIETFLSMSARNCLLTHFSQRYPKLPNVNLSQDSATNIALGFDLMSIKVGEFWRFTYFLDAMRELFRELEEGVSESVTVMCHED